MAILTVQTHAETHRIVVAAGQSVRQALDTTDLRVRAACGGTGTCGACVVQILDGAFNQPGLADFQKLNAEERATGRRLACQLYLEGDGELQLDDPAPHSAWRSLPEEALAPAVGALPDLREAIYGVAVDLGTTHIRVALWDRKRGKRIATRWGANPQATFGADVLNRLDAAGESPARAETLAELARSAILHALRDMLARDVGEVSPVLAEIGEVLIVGNTAMLALLSGRGGEALVSPAYWQRQVDCAPPDSDAWRSCWHMPHARILLLPPVAGFVGSDLLAGLLATGLADGPPASLLMDVGTNTEMALWDGQVLHVTSVPGGPAFEGCGIRNGMPAAAGAICRVHDCGEQGFQLETIGGAPARGFCASGLADAVAVLLAAGHLKPSGRFAHAPGSEGLALDPGNPRTALCGMDVDAFQRAKAAMAAAMETLLIRAGLHWASISRLCVCGAFGRTLALDHAQAVGLLPTLPAQRIELHGDASLAGCERALLAEQGEALFSALRGRIRLLNLSFDEAYEFRYLEHLRLRPIASTPPTSPAI